MNVLAVAAHPVDIEMTCAGALVKYARAGHGVTMVAMCGADSAARGVPQEKWHARWGAEAQQAAAIIGAYLHLLGYPEVSIPPDDGPAMRLLEILRRVQPRVVITHAPDDGLVDHQRTSEAVEHAVNMAQTPTIEIDLPPVEIYPFLVYMDNSAGLNFHPEEYVDITDVFEIKREMVEAHRSLNEPWQGHPVLDTMDIVEVCSRYRGLQCGVRYAEAYRRVQKWGRMSAERLLPQ